MPVKNEKDYLHVRLNKKRADKLRKISRRTLRSAATEAGLAVDQYKPRAVYRDDGR